MVSLFGGANAFAEPVRSPPQLDTAFRCRKPEYPRESFQQREEGKLTARFLIGPDGRVQKTEVVTSSGFPRLDEATVNGLSQCRFVPAKIDGEVDPEPAWTLLTYTWKIN